MSFFRAGLELPLWVVEAGYSAGLAFPGTVYWTGSWVASSIWVWARNPARPGPRATTAYS